MARREVLRYALGVIPEWFVDAGVVTVLYEGTRSDTTGKFDVLRVSDSLGPFARLFFSTETSLPMRLEYQYATSIPRPTPQTVTMHFERHRTLDGNVLPFAIAREYNGKRTGVLLLETYRFGVSWPDEVFQKPEDGAIEKVLPPVRGKA